MYVRLSSRSPIVATVLLVVAGSALLGQVPAATAQSMTKQIEYLIHETPTDPESAVRFRIKLSLQSGDRDGDSIGWNIASIEIREVGSPERVWVDNNPSVPTPVGLWWVEHVDPDDPQNDEFTMPPHMQGTAVAQASGGADLAYDFEGKTYTPPAPSEQPPYEITAALDYSFILDGENEPIGSGEDEPVEVPPRGSGG